MAQATDRWAADAVEASAALPLPRGNAKLTGATLSCAAQRWTLRLDAEGALPAGDGDDTAALTVDGRRFEVKPVVEAGGLAMRMPREAVEPLKEGLRMEIDFSGSLEEALGDLVFPLRGSRIAISAVEERCSRRDMSAYQAVTFTPYSSYLNLVRELRGADIASFAAATASQPEIGIAMTELGEGRRLLFTRLCGSSWYYGMSGCNVTGFAPADPRPQGEGSEGDEGPAWRVVYDTENVFLHLDPNSDSRGWPDIVTLPVRTGGGAGLIWRWNGEAYALSGELPDETADD